MTLKTCTISTLNMTITINCCIALSQIAGAAEDTHRESTLLSKISRLEQEALNLINQRSAAMHLKLPPLALRGNPRSRYFDAYSGRSPSCLSDDQGWRSHLGNGTDGVVEMDLATAYRLSTLHSDAYQQRVESLFLAAFACLECMNQIEQGHTNAEESALAQQGLDVEIKKFSRFRQELMVIVAAGSPAKSLSSQPEYPPPQLGTATLGGYLGLVQQHHWIHRTRDLLADYSKQLSKFERYAESGLITGMQVDACRQIVEQERAQLDAAEIAFAARVDSFKVNTLGLPTDLMVRLEPLFGRQFELIDPSAKRLAERNREFRQEITRAILSRGPQQTEHFRSKVSSLLADAKSLLSKLNQDLQQLDAVVPSMQRQMPELDKESYLSEMRHLQTRLEFLSDEISKSDSRPNGISSAAGISSLDRYARFGSEIDRFVTNSSLLLARVRLEMPRLDPVKLDHEQTLHVRKEKDPSFLENQEQVQKLHGRLFLPSQRPENDIDWTRRVVDYQRVCRVLRHLEDQIEADVRFTLDCLARLEKNFEIQRKAVAIAIRRLDLCSRNLAPPMPPANMEQLPPFFGDTVAMDMIMALSDFRDSQHELLSVWLTHYAKRLQLYSDLGMIEIDKEGHWTVAGSN